MKDDLKERIDRMVAQIPDEIPDDVEFDEEGADFDFKVETYADVESESDDSRIEALLNDGWQIDNSFIRGSRLTLVFSRERE